MLAEACVEARARRGRRGRSTGSPAPSWSARATSRRSRSFPPTAYGPKGHTVVAADFVSAEDGTGIVHTAVAFGEDDFRLGARAGPDRGQPGAPRRHLRRPRRPLRRARRARGRRPTSSPTCAAAAACSRPRPTSTPTRTAGAAARRSSTTPSRPGTSPPRSCATACSRPTRPSPGTPTTSSTGASATGWRTTSTGRCRATATGARRCRCGAAASGHTTCVGSLDELERALAACALEDPHRPFVDDVAIPCERVRRRDAPRARGDRRLVRLRLHAVRAAPRPVREPGAVRGRVPGRLHLRGAGPDARLVLLAAGGLDAALRPVRLPQRRSAWA